jgi:hypothetical protein
LLGCPKKWDFLKNGMNMVDVLAIMPYYVELLMSQQALLVFIYHAEDRENVIRFIHARKPTFKKI